MTDDNPFFLVISPPGVQIDLDQPGWVAEYADLMRQPGRWYLCRRVDGVLLLAMTVLEGEQPYYTKRHIGQIVVASGVSRETVAHGIGKKRLDGHVDRLWVLPGLATVCGGDDVEQLTMEFVHMLDWQEPSPEV